MIFSRVSHKEGIDVAINSLNKFARKGLRTLVLSKRMLTTEEYLIYDKKINFYINSVEDKE